MFDSFAKRLQYFAESIANPAILLSQKCQRAGQLLSALPTSLPDSLPEPLPSDCKQTLKRLADPRFWFNAAVSAGVAAGVAGGKADSEAKQAAISLVANDDPLLHRAFLLATNRDLEARRHIEAKFANLFAEFGVPTGKPIAIPQNEIKPLGDFLRTLADKISDLLPTGTPDETAPLGFPIPPTKKARLMKPVNKTPKIPKLSDRQYNILVAMLELKALTAESRTTIDRIAVKSEGAAVSPEQFKRPMSGLKKRRLVDSKTGRDGGCWLTDKGQELAERLKNNRNAKR